MNIAIVSYSYTGNNGMLAECVARDLSAAHIKVEVKPRVTTGTIFMGLVFGRTPKVRPAPEILGEYDLILLFGPVWMGQAAFPLRAYLRYLKANPKPYGFLSISGGADGINPKLSDELLERTGVRPVILLDQHIKDLLSSSPKPARKDTSAYKISEAEAKALSDIVIKEISKFSRLGTLS